MSRHKQPVATVEREKEPLLPIAEATDRVDAPKAAPAGAKQEPRSAKEAVAPNDYSDWLFAGSFVAAGVFGLFNAINHIRHNFYESFVKPSVNSKAMMVPAAEAKHHHPFGDLFKARKDAYEKLSAEYGAGRITGREMAAGKLEVTLKHDALVSERAVKEFGIHTKGWRSWTTDIWKQRAHTGTYARRHAALTMASTTVLGVAAISTLKYTKHLLDRIDENEKQQQDFLTERKAFGGAVAQIAGDGVTALPRNVVSQVDHIERVAEPARHMTA